MGQHGHRHYRGYHPIADSHRPTHHTTSYYTSSGVTQEMDFSDLWKDLDPDGSWETDEMGPARSNEDPRQSR